MPEFVWILVGVAVLVLTWVVATLNRIVALRNHIAESWSGIDVALKRRYDLIPNLVETVKGYATHEQEVIDRIVKAREHAIGTLGAADVQALSQNELVSALNHFFVRVEAYPQLKASEHFMELQRELANTEDRIAAARRFYNANVRAYNTMVESFPASMVAGSNVRAPYFEVESLQVRETPAVSV